MTSSPRELADRFHEQWLQIHPFTASSYGIPGYDHLVPDASEAGEAAWRSTVESVLAEARIAGEAELSEADGVTLGCLIEAAEREIVDLESAELEHTVSPMPFAAPASLLAVCARTVIATTEAADAYVTRLGGAGTWIDQVTERLRIGAAKGRLPVAPLVEQAIAWAEAVLAQPVPAALTTPQPPEGWDGADAWRERRDAVAVDVMKPALGRWVDALRDLLPRARPSTQPGLTYIPGGVEDYARAIRLHTTLPLTPDQLHRTGLDELAAIEKRVLDLGAEFGLTNLAAIHAAMRQASADAVPEQAIEAAVHAIRRAEARAAEVFPEPLPAPCVVTPMPEVVAASGMAPHYTPPRLDGTRPGTYWFNTQRPTAGTGWDLEGVAFHEAVPGHHLQLSRIQLLTDLPALQRQRGLTVFSEGWALYAEQLAEEMGLYSDARSLAGACATGLMRAARLVLDTGIHAFGWSREQALEFYTAHVPLPPEYLANEIDRYVIWPGQALAYLTGKLEMLRLRDEARRRLGDRFALPEFHATVLDSGSLPMPVLQRVIDHWTGSR